MPVASDLPMIDTVIVEVAEPDRIRTACAASAKCRSCRRWPRSPTPWRDATGIRFTELPLSPPRVLERTDARRREGVPMVHFSSTLTRHTGGLEQITMDAPRVNELIAAIVARFPGTGT